MNAPRAAVPAPGARSVRKVMGLVLLALMPGVLAQAWLLDASLGARALLAVCFALACEAGMLLLRRRPLWRFVSDFSAPITALLLAALLPPLTPWWITGTGAVIAVVFAKHLFGGLGDNPFNPAMAAYAALLLLFPAQVAAVFGGPPAQAGASLATGGLFALGGMLLLWRKLIPWQTPLAMVIGALLASALLKHASGLPEAMAFAAPLPVAVVLAAFFIVTDPVTGCLSPRGRLAFGLGAGVLTSLLAPGPGSADGLPFAVLLMNCLAPWIDRHTRPARPPATVPAADMPA